jgi:hypothetical protein
MRKLRLISDGFGDGRENGAVATSRPQAIAIDEVFPITTDPKEYLEGRVAFYIALLERLVRVGADRGDPYFIKECLDGLLKMTNIGRQKMDLNVAGTVSKLRDEIDFTAMGKEDLDAFIKRARGEIDVRHESAGAMLGDNNVPMRDLGNGTDSSNLKPRRKRKKQHNYVNADNIEEQTVPNDGKSGAGPAVSANGGEDSTGNEN